MQGHKFIRSWTYVPRSAGLHHCGRSCRRRWADYLSPDIKHDKITEEEEELITKLNSSAGKRLVSHFNLIYSKWFFSF